jgi:hypothetical protein
LLSGAELHIRARARRTVRAYRVRVRYGARIRRVRARIRDRRIGTLLRTIRATRRRRRRARW